MQHNFIITPPPPKFVIHYEDGTELEHLPPFYYCGVASCPCHQDPELRAALQAKLNAGEIDAVSALRIYWDVK